MTVISVYYFVLLAGSVEPNGEREWTASWSLLCIRYRTICTGVPDYWIPISVKALGLHKDNRGQDLRSLSLVIMTHEKEIIALLFRVQLEVAGLAAIENGPDPKLVSAVIVTPFKSGKQHHVRTWSNIFSLFVNWARLIWSHWGPDFQRNSASHVDQ